jgi:hypothetical protein
VRQTAPPAQPLLEAPEPIYRGAMPDERQARPTMQWTPVPSNRPTGPPTVRLGAPEFSPAAPGPNTIRGPGFSP